MLKVAKVNAESLYKATVTIEADKPEELQSPEAKNLALDNSGLAGQRSLDPLSNSGIYPVDSQGNEVPFGAPAPLGLKHRVDYVVNTRA